MAVPVEAFALEPLATVQGALHVAGRGVVHDAVAEHMVEGVGFLDVAAPLADDNREFRSQSICVETAVS